MLAVAGVAMLSGIITNGFDVKSSVGLLLELSSGLLYAIYMVAYPNMKIKNMGSLKTNFFVFLMAMMLLALYSLFTTGYIQPIGNINVFFHLLLLGFIPCHGNEEHRQHECGHTWCFRTSHGHGYRHPCLWRTHDMVCRHRLRDDCFCSLYPYQAQRIIEQDLSFQRILRILKEAFTALYKSQANSRINSTVTATRGKTTGTSSMTTHAHKRMMQTVKR